MTLARFFGLAAAVVVLVAMVNCDWWRHSFKRNPKLSLVLSERDDYMSVWAPVVEPSGTELYYLRRSGWLYDADGSGELWRAKTDGTQARLVMEGSFRAFALSVDGARLALATDSGYLLLADADGRLEETLTVVEWGTLCWVCFSRQHTGRVYYGVDQLTYAISLDGSGRREVPYDSVEGFPWVQPSGRHSLVTLHPDDFEYDLGVVEAATGDSNPLHTPPYRQCWLNSVWSCWSPNEDAVFFSAYEWQKSDPMRPTPAEIWKYEPVFGR